MNTLVDQHTKLVDDIFDKAFAVLAPPMLLDAAMDLPKASVKTVTQVDPLNHVVHTVTQTNEHRVVAALFSHTRYTNNKEKNREIGSQPIEVLIPIAHMAEILDLGGTFTLVNYKEAPMIVDIIESYLKVTEERSRWEPHFKLPPPDDMNKLVRLAVAIKPLSNRVVDANELSGDWGMIESLFATTGKYQIGKDNDSFFDPVAVANDCRVDHRAIPRNPYKF